MQMQITQEQLTQEAASMALELRFKDHVIAALEDEVAKLRGQLNGDSGHSHAHAPQAAEAPAA